MEAIKGALAKASLKISDIDVSSIFDFAPSQHLRADHSFLP